MRKEERNRGSVRVKLIWGTGNGENLSGCTVDPWLQLNWTQETGPLGRGRGGEREGGRQEGRIRACASEEENFNWRQFVESPGGWNPPGSSRLLNFTRMTTLYTVTPPSSPRFETFHPSCTRCLPSTNFSSFFPRDFCPFSRFFLAVPRDVCFTF